MFEEVFATKGISDKVSLQMQYIGTLNSSEPLGVSCMHGEAECLGDAHQLCLHKYLSLQDFYANIACQNYQSFPGHIGSLDLTRQCADASGVDWKEGGVGRCIERKQKYGLGIEGRKLLRENVKRTVESGVKKSCTVLIGSTMVKGGERRCAVDGGVWQGCDVSLDWLMLWYHSCGRRDCRCRGGGGGVATGEHRANHVGRPRCVRLCTRYRGRI